MVSNPVPCHISMADVATPSSVSGSELEQTQSLGLGAISHSYIRHMIHHMTGTSEHSVSIIEFYLGMIELHARNCSRTIFEHNPSRPGGEGLV